MFHFSTQNVKKSDWQILDKCKNVAVRRYRMGSKNKASLTSASSCGVEIDWLPFIEMTQSSNQKQEFYLPMKMFWLYCFRRFPLF